VNAGSADGVTAAGGVSSQPESAQTTETEMCMQATSVVGREPLVLLHGLGMSARVWDRVRPLLEPHHDVFVPTALGHRGGATALHRPVSVRDLVDEVERTLDERGLDRPHVAGNSLGGWIAIELARRGRARTACALSPAGSWQAGTAEQTAGVRKIRRLIRTAPLGRGVPVLMRSAVVRRLALRDVAEHGERLTAAEAVEGVEDLLGCAIAEDILSTDEEIAPLDPLPCPITLAWASEDAVLPVAVNGAVARARLPQARFTVIAGAGHVPMIDDPEGVSRTILQATAAVAERGSAAPPSPATHVPVSPRAR
jgi:pimeloyl-ACP methyl ester carboxylesterase